MVYEIFHDQINLADGWYRTRILPVIHRRICNVVSAWAQHGNLHHWVMEAARHHGGLRHVPAVRPRHLPQPCHQPDSVIRVRSVPDYRLRRLRETVLSPVVQPAEPVPAVIGDPADSGHPAGDLRDLHTARLHPPSTIRRHHRQAARTLV